MRRTLLVLASLALLGACKSQNIEITKPDGSKQVVTFYKGSDEIPDLFIIDGVNYFGKVGYDDGDPLTDLSWRGEDGTKANAECVKQGPQKYDKDKTECKLYEVFRSTNELIPSGSTFDPPSRI